LARIDRIETRSEDGVMADGELLVWIDDLDPDVCWRLLGRRQVGRVGFMTDEGPVVLPVNHCVDGRTIVFRTGRTTLLEALRDGAPVAFEVDDADSFGETGWSVLAKGRAFEVTDPADHAQVTRLPLHPWAPGERDHWLRVVPESVSGRAISRRRAASDGRLLPYMPAD